MRKSITFVTPHITTNYFTDDHLVLLVEGKYVRADELKIGDVLYYGNKVISIEEVEEEKSNE